MNKDTCTHMMNTFLSLDKNEKLPLRLTIHLLRCKKCRSQVRLFTQAEKQAKAPLLFETPFSEHNITSVMKKIDPNFDFSAEKSIPQVSLLSWILFGFIMILFILIFGLLSDSGKAVGMQALLSLLFAVFITGYCGFFVGSNLDFFIKQIETHIPEAHSALQ